MIKTGLPNLKAKPFGGAYSVHDPEQIIVLNESIIKFPSLSYDANNLKHEFFETYKKWMPKYHNLQGIKNYSEACFTNGTTESFVNFYLKYKGTKRLRIAKGDYFYHKMTQKMYFDGRRQFEWLDNDELRSGDLVVLSCPFSDSGSLRADLEELLTRCDQLKIPVMLDLAYINISENMSINLNHKCIDYVVSSLSKAFPLENHRVGIRLQREKHEDPLYVINEDDYNYLNTLSLYVSTELMKKFPSNYITQKYKDAQRYWCEKLDIMPSECVIFGIDTKNKYPEYSRGLETNRLCFSRVWDGRKNYGTQ